MDVHGNLRDGPCMDALFNESLLEGCGALAMDARADSFAGLASGETEACEAYAWSRLCAVENFLRCAGRADVAHSSGDD